MRFSLKTTSDKQPNPKYTPPATVQNHIADPGKMVPKTNADRIRAMSDEELADFMVRRNVTESCLRLADEGYTPTEEQKQVLYDSLYPVWMEWLHAPAEGE